MLSDILRVELFRKESSSEHPTGYGSVFERIGLILRERRKPYFPWGTQGGPDNPARIADVLSSFLGSKKHATAGNEADAGEGSVDALLPPKAGPYVREEFRGLEISKGRITYATYRMNDVLVFVELGICDDSAAARLALETARSELSSEYPDAPLWEERRGDSLFLVGVNPRGAFAAWTQGAYYYSAHTVSGKADLDAFLRIFGSMPGPTVKRKH